MDHNSCVNCKYEGIPITAEPCFSCKRGLGYENTNRTDKFESVGYVPGTMTDEQALKILKSAQISVGRASAKTAFNTGLLEAFSRAIKALEEKVDKNETN